MTAQPKISDLLRLPPGEVDLAAIDPRSTPGFDGDKAAGKAALPELAAPLQEMQEKLFAEAYTGETSRRVLLVLQGMDTSGKGGVLSHTVGLLDPAGMKLRSFKKPTEEELAHDFLWRIEKALPDVGEIGIFDRSHYEDVLVVRVHEIAPLDEIEARYERINEWEQQLAETGTTIIKCMLHISADEQKARLLARLDDPTKQWKFKPGDVDERAMWDEYQAAYTVALERCSTAAAPWFVIPSDRKWYRNWAIAQLLKEHLEALRLEWPKPSYDVAEQRARLSAEPA